ncbi:MAG: hypothetical protein V3U29_06470, partial [Phycisphaeraceae bacterium]
MYLLIRQFICLFLLATLIGCGDTEQKPSADAPEEQQPDAISTSETEIASEDTGVESMPEPAGTESTPELAGVESTPELSGAESTPELSGAESTPEPAALSAKDATVPAGSTSPPRDEAQPEQELNNARETDIAWQTDFDVFLQAFDKSVRANPG